MMNFNPKEIDAEQRLTFVAARMHGKNEQEQMRPLYHYDVMV